MSFSKFFRKKYPDLPSSSQVLPQKMKAAHSLDGIKDYTKSLDQTESSLPTSENRLDDISVHLAASKYSHHFSRKSQLSKTLIETINDKDALAYFIQFLESREKSNFVKFWLDVHTFQTCFSSRLNSSCRCMEMNTDYSNEDWSIDVGASAEVANRRSPQWEATKSERPTNGTIPTSVQGVDSLHLCNQKCTGTESDGKHSLDPDASIWEDMSNDAILIFGKYFSPDSRLLLDPPDELRDSTARRVCRCQVDRTDGLSCFEDCQVWAYDILEKEYYPVYLQSSYHCKHQLDILTGNFLTITDIIHHETSLSYFTEFMEQHGCLDYLQCFLDVDNFQCHFSEGTPQYDPAVAQADAMIIYDKFFSLQALRPLNLSDGVRLELEGAICREGGPLPDCFLLPRSLLLYKMEQDHLPKFLKSDLYYKYLVDLMNTVHASKDIPAYHRKRTGSDASSEKSFETVSSNSVGSRNTLLAIDTLSKHSRRPSQAAKESMQMDGSLFDPNNLWHRPNTSLKLGHVNSLGQFIPEYEPEPDHMKKKKFGFSFFGKSSKSEEDLAVQFAQQVIQDVNILTNYASALDDEEDDEAVLR